MSQSSAVQKTVRNILVIRASLALASFAALFASVFRTSDVWIISIPLLVGLYRLAIPTYVTRQLIDNKRAYPFTPNDLPTKVREVVSEALTRVSLNDAQLLWQVDPQLTATQCIPAFPNSCVGVPLRWRAILDEQMVADLIITILSWPKSLRRLFLVHRFAGPVIIGSAMLVLVVDLMHEASRSALPRDIAILGCQILLGQGLLSLTTRTKLRYFEEIALTESAKLLPQHVIDTYRERWTPELD